MCEQHVTVIAAGSGAGLNYYTHFYAQGHQINLNGHDMIKGKGDISKTYDLCNKSSD